MRKSFSRLVKQLDLFHPVPKRPAWRKLPADLQENAIALLARLLREHRAGHVAPQDRKEPADE